MLWNPFFTLCVSCICTLTLLPLPTHTAFPSTGLKWSSVVIGGGGFVPAIIFHPAKKDLLYTRTDIGGIYRWDTKGNWIPLTDLFNSSWNNYLGAESIGIDLTDPNRLYYAAGLYTESWSSANGAIFASTDQGNTWKTRWDAPFKMGGNDDGRSAGERLVVNPASNNIIYYGSQSNGLWKSTNFGATFTQDPTFHTPSNNNNGRGVVLVVFDPSTPTGLNIIVGVDDFTSPLYLSSDGGKSWNSMLNQPVGFFPHHVAFSSDAKTMFVTYDNGPGPNGITQGAVYKRDLATGKWTDISPFKPAQNGNPNCGFAGLSTDKSDPNTLVVSTIDRWYPVDDVYRSTNGGSTWISLSSTAKLDISQYPYLNFGGDAPKFGWWMGTVQIDPFNPNRILFGTGATIYGTDNAQEADKRLPTLWTPRVSGLEECAVLDLASPPTYAQAPALYSAVGDVAGFTHTDITVSPKTGMWTNPTFGNGNSVDFAQLKPTVVVRVGGGNGSPPQNGAVSTDSGHTWKAFAKEPANTMGGGVVAVSADASTIVWTPNQRQTFFSSDSGVSWTASQGLSMTSSLPVKSDRVSPSTFYAYESASSSVYTSNDYGKSFNRTSNNSAYQGYSIAVSWAAKGDLWIPSWNGLFHSTNGGVTFTKLTNVTSADAVGFGRGVNAADKPAVYIAGIVNGFYGIHGSLDYGSTWARLNDATHQWGWLGQRVIGDPKTFGRVYVATNGRGIVTGSV